MEHPFLMFLDHTQRRTTVGRSPLDEWSARPRDLYLIIHNTHNRQTSMPPSRIRTHDLSRWAVADLRLRPRGHWDRHVTLYKTIIHSQIMRDNTRSLRRLYKIRKIIKKELKTKKKFKMFRICLKMSLWAIWRGHYRSYFKAHWHIISVRSGECRLLMGLPISMILVIILD